MNSFEKTSNMGNVKRKRKAKIRMPSEAEYYAAFEKWDPDYLLYSEKARRSAKALKENPPPYELIKKTYDKINANRGYR
jgi:hypothetical protein